MANKEKGFTLIEILLTMAILSIVGVLAISLLLQTTKTKNTVTSRINLSSEANIILAAIEKEYYSHNQLCFSWNEKNKRAYIVNGDKKVLLHAENIEIEKFETVPVRNENGCVETAEKLNIQLMVNQKGRKGSPFEIETTLKKL